jgi:probable HAF family extracellular repeat protein
MKSNLTRCVRENRSRQSLFGFYGRTFAAVAVIALGCFNSPAVAQQYAVTSLGTLTGFPFTNPSSINSAGQVAGTGDTADFSSFHPFRTRANAVINPATDDLGVLTSAGATSGSAASINASGQVVGTADIPIVGSPGFFFTVAFRADPGNPNLVNLGTRNVNFLGTNTSNANGINNAGQVTGGASTEEAIQACLAEVQSQAYRTAPNGLVAGSDEIGTTQTANCGFSEGYGINSSGQVVGSSNKAGFFGLPIHAFLATPNMTDVDLGTLGAYALNSTAFAINDSGQVVGQAGVSSSINHAFLVNSGSSLVMQDLGTLGGSNSSASSINSSGQIVGNSLLSGDSAIHAFIYQHGAMADLNTLIPSGTGWVLQNATGINDIGQIIGTGTLNGSFTAFRLDPAGVNGVSILTSELSNGSLPLNTGQVNVLRTTLNVAAFFIRVGPAASPLARAALTVFVDQVTLLERGGQLTGAQAAPLISEAQNVEKNLP